MGNLHKNYNKLEIQNPQAGEFAADEDFPIMLQRQSSNCRVRSGVERLVQGAVGIDARDGLVAVAGWAETSQITMIELANRFQDAGVSAIIYTDISRDGALKGINIDSTIALANAISIPVIASGGLASIDDVKKLVQPECRRIAGVIAGRALYDGRLDPAAALELARTRTGAHHA